MKIQILGTGCPKCKKLVENAKLAVSELGIRCEIEKVSKIDEIIKFGVMVTPAFAVDGKVKSSGKILSPEEIRDLLKQGA